MNESPNPRKSPHKPPQPERFQPKVLIIWLVIFAAILGLWALSQPRESAQLKLPPQKLLAYAREGSIDKLTLKPVPSNGRMWHDFSGTLVESADVPESVREAQQQARDNPLAPGGDEAATADGIRFSGSGGFTEEQIGQLTTALGEKVSWEPPSTLMKELLVGLLPFLLIIGLLYFLFVRQLRSAGRGAMNFGKSRAKLLTRDREKVTFKDVAGCDEAKEEISEVVDFLRDPKKFQKIGGRVPRGVLMVGPPGTGKTLLAKAVAGEADVPFFSISGSDFVEMFVGVGAARVRDMFEQGRKSAPCLIFIDEIDAVGRQRGAGLGGGNDEREQTLNSLLVEMDGFEGHEGVIIIAATNRPDVLDQALLRPGRFDRQIMIDLPDLAGREEILRVHAKKVKLAADADLNRVARTATGFSGADLANLLNEAALIAARNDKTEIAAVDIEEAHDKIRFGRERRKLMDAEDKRNTAYHEAGHALIQAYVNDPHMPLHKVTILPRGRALGMAMAFPTKDLLGKTRTQFLNDICMAMGGRIGEEVKTGDFSSGAQQDIKQATAIARHMVCDWGMSELGPVALGENQDQVFLGKEITRTQNYSEDTARKIDAEIARIITEQYERAKTIISERKDALETIAQSLLEYETIEGKHVMEILEHGEIRSEVIHNKLSRDSSEPGGGQEEKDRKKKQEDEGGEFGAGPAPAPSPA